MKQNDDPTTPYEEALQIIQDKMHTLLDTTQMGWNMDYDLSNDNIEDEQQKKEPECPKKKKRAEVIEL